MTRPPRSQQDERGSTTLLAVVMAILSLSAGLTGALWAAVSTGHHRAAAAADLAALSAAQELQSPGADACTAARRIVGEHGADLLDCEIKADTVLVVAGIRLHFGALGSPYTTAAARAGPVGGGPAQAP